MKGLITKCRTCGAEIVFVKTKQGKNIPLDARILTVITDEGEAVRGRQAHFSTCPDADLHRRGPS